MRSFFVFCLVGVLAIYVDAQISIGSSSVIAPCPIATPCRCANSQCVVDVSFCNVNNCTGTTPYLCSDNTCQVSSIYCNCPGVVCSDGSCKNSINDCPILDGCSELYPKRCGDGSCQPYNYDCSQNHTGPTCPTQLQKCIDGICRVSTLCDALPYHGCKDYQCPDGSCTSNYSTCLCTADPTKVRCFDGTCVPIGTKCAQTAPAYINAMNVTYTVATGNVTTVTVPSSSSLSTTVASITLPSNVLSSTQQSSGQSISTVSIGGVASATTVTSLVINPNTNTAQPAVLASPSISVTLANGQSQMNAAATLTFASVTPPAGSTINDLCVAFLNTSSNTWECVGGVALSNNSVTSQVSHFSIYSVIVKPGCQVDGTERPYDFCSRQHWPTGNIGYYCAQGGKKFYMCWDAPYTSSSSLMSCPAGTKCTCCSTDECSLGGTVSPCR